eukprot:355004-Pleurochrysis_carterae.AAC.1
MERDVSTRKHPGVRVRALGPMTVLVLFLTRVTWYFALGADRPWQAHPASIWTTTALECALAPSLLFAH